MSPGVAASAIGAVVLAGLLISIAAGLLLYWAVRHEGRGGESMSRADAERTARRDLPDETDETHHR